MKKSILFIAVAISVINLNAQLKVTSTNKIGLGTINPLEKLHVVGSGVFSLSSSANLSPFIKGTNSYSTATTPSYTWYTDQNTGIFHPATAYMGFSVNGSESMLLIPGSIKINATVEWARTLYIQATSANHVGYHMNLSGTDNFYVKGNGQVWANGWVLTSDIRLKKDIKPIENALTNVLKLNGVTFNWIDEKSLLEKSMGLIAQEVEKIIPEVVRTSHDGRKGIEYANLVGLLVEAIKEQQIQIDELKTNQNNIENNTTAVNSNYSENITKPLLFQNAPNPFSEKTEIKYFIPTNATQASIYIYNMNGTQLKEFKINNRDNGSIFIEGAQLDAGMYLYTLIVDQKEIETKRMILTK